MPPECHDVSLLIRVTTERGHRGKYIDRLRLDGRRFPLHPSRCTRWLCLRRRRSPHNRLGIYAGVWAASMDWLLAEMDSYLATYSLCKSGLLELVWIIRGPIYKSNENPTAIRIAIKK